MGGRSSCSLFEKLSTGLKWIARTKLGIPHIIHILDAFVIIDKTLSDCSNHLEQFLHLCADVGVPMAPQKMRDLPTCLLLQA